MLELLRVRPPISARIRSGPVGPCIDDFVAALQRDGYRPGVIRRHVHAADRFGGWLQRRGRRLEDVDEVLLTRFISRLKRRRSASRSAGHLSSVAHGTRRLGMFLWATGLAIRRPCGETAQDQCLRSFDEYLAGVRGAAPGTRRIYLRYARRFLAHQFGRDAPTWSMITAAGIAAFVRTEAAPLGASSCRTPASAVRTWLRFLVSTGDSRAGMEAAVPTIRQWKHAALPRILSEEETQRVLALPARVDVRTAARDQTVRRGSSTTVSMTRPTRSRGWRNGRTRTSVTSG